MPSIDVILIKPFLDKTLIKFNINNLTVTRIEYKNKNQFYEIDIYDNTNKLCPVYKALLGKNDHMIASTIIPFDEKELIKSNSNSKLHLHYKMIICDSESLLTKADQDKALKEEKDKWEAQKQEAIKQIESNAEERMKRQKEMYDKIIGDYKGMITRSQQDNITLAYSKNQDMIDLFSNAYQDKLNKINKTFNQTKVIEQSKEAKEAKKELPKEVKNENEKINQGD